MSKAAFYFCFFFTLFIKGSGGGTPLVAICTPFSINIFLCALSTGYPFSYRISVLLLSLYIVRRKVTVHIVAGGTMSSDVFISWQPVSPYKCMHRKVQPFIPHAHWHQLAMNPLLNWTWWYCIFCELANPVVSCWTQENQNAHSSFRIVVRKADCLTE